jgi:hypothetical protein
MHAAAGHLQQFEARISPKRPGRECACNQREHRECAWPNNLCKPAGKGSHCYIHIPTTWQAAPGKIFASIAIDGPELQRTVENRLCGAEPHQFELF